MRAVSTHLQSLYLSTSGFTTVSQADFACEHQAELLMTGKGLTFSGSIDGDIASWIECGADFEHTSAAAAVVGGKLRRHAAELVGFVFTNTANLTEVTADWIADHPFALPVLVNAMGMCSKKKFKDDFNLTTVTDRKIGKLDAERIADGIIPGKVLSDREVVASMEGLIEGIVRDLIGKVVNEAFMEQALERACLPYVRDEGGTNQIEGELGSSRADFALPHNIKPEAFVEVRKSKSNHAAIYSRDMMLSVISRRSRHPKCLAVLIYDGVWSGTTKVQMAKVFDFIFHVFESDRAAEVIKRHMNGEDMRKKGRAIYLTAEEPIVD